MPIVNIVCCKCKKTLPYDETVDQLNDPVVPIKVMKVVELKDNSVIKFYDFPKDKQKIIKPELIKHCCLGCSKL